MTLLLYNQISTLYIMNFTALLPYNEIILHNYNSLHLFRDYHPEGTTNILKEIKKNMQSH